MSDRDDDTAQNLPAVRGRPFAKGDDSRRGTSGGRPRALREIEAMLDAEHRNVDRMREVFARLRFLAMGEPVVVEHKGQQVRIELKAHPEFMRLYLERLMGPVKELIPDDLLLDAPEAVIDWLRRQN